MGSIGRYIFRTTFGAFLVVLVSLTAVIWVTQALHDFDLVTSQGQTIVVFMGITALIIPLLVLVIAPIALLIAVAHVLNKLSTDSEIIVMNAAGYVDDCLILAVNYITNYTYSGNPVNDHTVMLQMTLRTLGGTSVSQGVSGGL